MHKTAEKTDHLDTIVATEWLEPTPPACFGGSVVVQTKERSPTPKKIAKRIRTPAKRCDLLVSRYARPETILPTFNGVKSQGVTFPCDLCTKPRAPAASATWLGELSYV